MKKKKHYKIYKLYNKSNFIYIHDQFAYKNEQAEMSCLYLLIDDDPS